MCIRDSAYRADRALIAYDHSQVAHAPSGATTNTGTVTSVATGTGITGGSITTSGTISLDFSELTDMTAVISDTTEFILQNSGVESRKAAGELFAGGKLNISNSGLVDIKADVITANEINATVGNFGKVVADIGFFNTLDTDVLNSNLVTTRTLQVGDRSTATANVNGTTSSSTAVAVDGISGTIAVGDIIRNGNNADPAGIADGTYPTVASVSGGNIVMSAAQTLTNDKGLYFVTGAGLPGVSGTTLSGKGAILKDDGDFFAGDSAGSYMFWDQSVGSLKVKGSGVIGGWNIDDNSIYSGTKDVSGFTSGAGHVTISSAGSIHAPTFYIDTAGDAFFAGEITENATIDGTDVADFSTEAETLAAITTTIIADNPIATWITDDYTNYVPSAGAGTGGGTTGDIDVTLRAINNGVASTATWRWTLTNFGSSFANNIAGAWEGTHTGWTNATVGGSLRNRTVVITYDSQSLTLRALAINLTISGGGK